MNNKFFFKVVLSVFAGFGCLTVSLRALALVPTDTPTKIVYFGSVNSEEFESKIKPFFLERLRSCKKCELINHTPYDAEGNLKESLLEGRIDSLPVGTSFLFFDFNLKSNDSNRSLVQALNKRADAGLVIVGSAGAPKEDESSGSLSKTVLGQVRGALIIGELAERDRLMPTGFYGPEMLTAIRPPKEVMGQGYSPIIFAAALADKWTRRTGQEWIEHFRSKKLKTRKLWLDLNDMFNSKN